MPTTPPTTPLAYKRRRITASTSSASHSPQYPPHFDATGLIAMNTTTDAAPFLPHIDPLLQLPELSSPERTQQSMKVLEAASHANRLAISSAEQSDKGTEPAYMRHFNSYMSWWPMDQAQRKSGDPSWKEIPALPITATKVSLFLAYETTREKKKRNSSETIAGTTVGKSQVLQVISALEHYRLNHQHEYPNNREAQIKLREDTRIRAYESAAKHNEPKRAESAQSQKAAGTSVDTYSQEELFKCSLWALTRSTTKHKLWVDLRDRAMLLFSATSAWRGQSLRQLLWSDFFLTSIQMNIIRPGFEVPVLGFLADNAKTNQSGRVDEHGVLRHRLVELCPVGALAMKFFAHFHIEKHPVPEFSPAFDKPGFGEYGRREWYDNHVFFASSVTSEMTYQTHWQRVTSMNRANSISITKVTHAGRPLAAQTARAHGATVTDTKALGGWQETGSFRACYDRALPAGALLGVAHFDANRPESYLLARDHLDPPADVLSTLFPWVEAEIAALDLRYEQNKHAQDTALKQLLKVFLFFRRVLAQDAAVLYNQNPHATLFTYAPFNTPAFRIFATSASSTIAKVESDARLALRNIPENIACSLRGAFEGFAYEQQRERDNTQKMFYELSSGLAQLTERVGNSQYKPSRSRRAEVSSVSCPMPALPPQSSPHAVSDNHPTLFTSDLPQNFGLIAPSPFIAPSPPPLSDFGPVLPSTPPAPAGFTNFTINISPTGTIISSSAPVLAPAAPTHSLPLTFNNSFNTPQPAPPPPPHLSTPFLPPTADPNVPNAKWVLLCRRFPATQLAAHKWTWTAGDWLPEYEHPPISRITAVWDEWADGIEGCIPVELLTKTWGAGWKRNIGKLKTENNRRMKIIKLVQELSALPGWSVDFATTFLSEQYEPRYKARAFSDYLTKDNGKNKPAVLKAADLYLKQRRQRCT